MLGFAYSSPSVTYICMYDVSVWGDENALIWIFADVLNSHTSEGMMMTISIFGVFLDDGGGCDELRCFGVWAEMPSMNGMLCFEDILLLQLAYLFSCGHVLRK